MKKEKKILYLAIYWILYGAVILKYFWSNQLVVLVPDILVAYLILFAKKPKRYPLSSLIGKAIPTLLALFIGLGIISAFLNLMPLTSTFWGVRMFLRYSLILYLVYSYFGYKDVLKFKKILYTSIPINFLFCIFQFGSGQVGDYMGGIMAGNGDLAAYLLVCLLLISIDYIKGKVRLLYFILFIITAFVEAMWAEIKLLYFLLPMSFYIIYILVKRFSLGHVVAFIVAAFFLLPTLKFVLSFYYNEQYIHDSFDMESVKTYTTESSYGYTDDSFNRITSIDMAHVYYLHDPYHLALGYGIGSGNYSNFFKTWIGNTATKTLYFYFTPSYVLIEVGWIGFVIFILGHLLLAYHFGKIYFKAKDRFLKQWGALGLTLTILTFVFMWYNACPYASWYLPYIMWGVCLVSIRERKIQLAK